MNRIINKSKISKVMSTPEEQERYEAFIEYLAHLLLKYGNKVLNKKDEDNEGSNIS